MLKEGFELLKKYSIPIPEYYINIFPEDIEFPVVVKADLFHKTEEKAVYLNINTLGKLLKAYVDLKNRFPDKDIIIQKQVIGDFNEIIIGIKKDETFEDIILIGIGGIYAELIRDFIILIPEFKKEDLEKRLKDLKFSKILFGYRNRPKINIDLLYDIINKLYKLYKEENLKEIEINPLLINDKEAYAVDIRYIK